MAATMDRQRVVAPPWRWHAFLLTAAFVLFLGALLGDWAYANSYEIQWSNFASWLLAGAMVFVGIALLQAIIDLARGTRARACLVLVVLAFALGLADCFVHAGDAWAIMPAGPILTAITMVLLGVATWLAFAGLRGPLPAGAPS